MIKNSIISDQNPSADQLKDLIRILQLDSNQRKRQQIDFLVDIMLIIPFFHKLKDQGDDLSQKLFCKYLKYESYRPSEMIFQTGSLGSKFYIILAGKVGIYAENNKMINLSEVLNQHTKQISAKQIKQDENIKLIKVLDAGASFGEMALYDENQPRVSSVYAHTDTFLGIIRREDYQYIMKRKEESQKQRDVKNLSSMSLFSGWTLKDLQTIVHNIKLLNCDKDDIIYQEKQLVQSVFLVLSGTFIASQIQKELDWEDFQTSVNEIMKKDGHKQQQNQKIRLIQANELFGEEEAIYGYKKRNHKVICNSETAQIYQMDLAVFEKNLFNKNQNTKQEILRRLQIKQQELSSNIDDKHSFVFQSSNDSQNLSKCYRTITLEFDPDKKEQKSQSVERQYVRKNDQSIKLNSIQDSQRSRKNTKILISRKSIGRGKDIQQSSLNYSVNQNSLESLKPYIQINNQSFNGYGADSTSLEREDHKYTSKQLITPIKERSSSIKNDILEELPSLYQKVKASLIRQSDNSKHPNSMILENPDKFILNFVPGGNKEQTNQMEQLHSQRNQELQDSILQKIQRTKTMESTNQLENKNILIQNEGVKGSKIFGSYNHLQRKKAMMIEQMFYNNKQNAKKQNEPNFKLHYGDYQNSQSIAIVLPNKMYKDNNKLYSDSKLQKDNNYQKRSSSINQLSYNEDQLYNQSLKKYVYNQVAQQNRERINELYNMDIDNSALNNKYNDHNLTNNHSTLQTYKNRNASRQAVSQRSSPRVFQNQKLQPLS